MTLDLLTPEQRLALAYSPSDKRDGLAAIWSLDARMRRIFSQIGNPMLAEIKLAWWQERLAELAPGKAPPEPLLQGLSSLARTSGIRAELSALAGAWRGFDHDWSAAAIDAYAIDRGRSVVALGSEILGAVPTASLLLAAEGAALIDLSSLAPEAASRTFVANCARRRFRDSGRPDWPSALRPLGMLVLLARRNSMSATSTRQGSPASIARMAWHAISGR